MMKIFWLFRSNLKNLEYYHEYNDFTLFKENCHDFYLNMGIWFLENSYFDEVVVWRLFDKPKKDIIFDINGKRFIQRWVKDFNEVFNYDEPEITFFRGGFETYDLITKKNPNFFGLKLYLAAGKRLLPQYGGIYDRILIEDEKDQIKNSIPFYKTTNSNIFKPLTLNLIYDLCIVSNFSQVKYKGTDFIISQIPKSKFLRKLKICHIGNNVKVGTELCKQHGVTNIEFLGSLDRLKINDILNQSKFGIVNSNRTDGCPRVITEILTSGTPLLINEQTRLLKYYKKFGVVEFKDSNFIDKMIEAFSNYGSLKKDLIENLDRFNMEKICKKNFELWK